MSILKPKRPLLEWGITAVIKMHVHYSIYHHFYIRDLHTDKCCHEATRRDLLRIGFSLVVFRDMWIFCWICIWSIRGVIHTCNLCTARKMLSHEFTRVILQNSEGMATSKCGCWNTGFGSPWMALGSDIRFLPQMTRWSFQCLHSCSPSRSNIHYCRSHWTTQQSSCYLF